MLPSIHVVSWSIHSAKQEQDAERRPKSPQVVEKAGQTRACALCIGDAWGVRKLRPPGRQRARIRTRSDGGIDAGEPGGGEPSRRLSEAAGQRSRGAFRTVVPMAEVTNRDAACKHAPQERLHEERRQCTDRCPGIGAAGGAPMRSMVRATANAPANGERSEPEHERCAKRARGWRCRRYAVGAKRNGPRRRRSDDAAREAVRIRRRSGPPGCRAGAPCRRGSR